MLPGPGKMVGHFSKLSYRLAPHFFKELGRPLPRTFALLSPTCALELETFCFITSFHLCPLRLIVFEMFGGDGPPRRTFSLFRPKTPAPASPVPTQQDPPAPSPRKQSTMPLYSHGAPPNYVGVCVWSYNLPWKSLREWLVNHFEHIDPRIEQVLKKEPAVKHDVYYFHLPRNLTPEEENAVRNLRIIDDPRTSRALHRGPTPDPDPTQDSDND
ncbi:hypothetical protein F4780DRAFT_651534 [Xylariomycetidae sp. FL0641]|nr:hypothetical protein F4780DRAFT_651534 [Xylariomycetidae sp. FL0641]